MKIPKYTNQHDFLCDMIFTSFVAAARQPFTFAIRSREHKKRRCPFASTPLRLPVLQAAGCGWAWEVSGINPWGSYCWLAPNALEQYKNDIMYVLYMSYLYLELYVYLFLTICTGGYLCQSLCAAGRQSKSSTPKIKWLHPQKMEHAIYLLSSV